MKKLRKMRGKYRADVARLLASKAASGAILTFTDLTAELGRNPRLWGDILGGIALRCHDQKLPILSILVVSKTTGYPSAKSKLFRDFGFLTPQSFTDEQKRCFAFDWSTFHFE